MTESEYWLDGMEEGEMKNEKRNLEKEFAENILDLLKIDKRRNYEKSRYKNNYK